MSRAPRYGGGPWRWGVDFEGLDGVLIDAVAKDLHDGTDEVADEATEKELAPFLMSDGTEPTDLGTNTAMAPLIEPAVGTVAWRLPKPVGEFGTPNSCGTVRTVLVRPVRPPLVRSTVVPTAPLPAPVQRSDSPRLAVAQHAERPLRAGPALLGALGLAAVAALILVGKGAWWAMSAPEAAPGADTLAADARTFALDTPTPAAPLPTAAGVSVASVPIAAPVRTVEPFADPAPIASPTPAPAVLPAPVRWPVTWRLDVTATPAVPASTLAPLVKSLRGCPEIVVTGHTCALGDRAINFAVGRSRAESVRDVLVASGIPADRVHVASAGADEPVRGNSTVAERVENRRVVLTCQPPSTSSP